MTIKKDLAIFLLLVVLCVIVTALNPRFLSPANLQNTARLIGSFGIFSVGLGLVIITGGIDLSVGSSFALLGVLLSIMLTEWHLSWPFAVLVIVVLAALVGAVHGLLITRLRLQPFVVTLCGLLVYRGLARFIADDETKGFGDAAGFRTLQHLMTGSLFGVPTPFVAMALIGAVMWVVLHRSVYGRHLFATGRNETAARFSGIDVRRTASLWPTFILLNMGNAMRVTFQIATDFTPHAFPIMGVSGFIEVVGLALWAYELVKNIRVGIRLERGKLIDTTTGTRSFAIVPQTPVGDVLRCYPQTRDVFFSHGFAPVSNPELRRTIPRVATLEQACRREGIDLNKLLVDLKMLL